MGKMRPKPNPQKRSSNIKKRGYRADLWAAFGKRDWCSFIFAKRGSKVVYSRVFVKGEGLYLSTHVRNMLRMFKSY